MASQGGASLKGLRLLTMDRGPEGYGFHMYTNKELKVTLNLKFFFFQKKKRLTDNYYIWGKTCACDFGGNETHPDQAT